MADIIARNMAGDALASCDITDVKTKHMGELIKSLTGLIGFHIPQAALSMQKMLENYKTELDMELFNLKKAKAIDDGN